MKREPRLQFSDADLAEPKLEKPIKRVKKAEAKAEAARLSETGELPESRRNVDGGRLRHDRRHYQQRPQTAHRRRP